MQELPPRTTLSHYRIVSKIGAGGMGEVYLAEDTELERQVALKILLAEVAGDENRLSRFVREARSASALNHPNILTVYEIGSFENSRFIATELIKGETLRERLQGERLTLRETLDVAVQVASALNAAHSARIVHRDIKPENIMLRDDGLVKVLDFGLAKLTEKKTEALDTEGETRAQVKTSPGMVMGTVAYMSPEQVRGKEIDARSDVWSLGVVLYEMLTGKTPFAEETTNDSIAAILTREPAPLDEKTLPELQRIIRKALQKQADERYQTVKDFLLDLKNLKRELEFAEELERSQIPFSTKASNVSARQSAENATAILPAAIQTQHNLPQPTSSAEYIVRNITNHKRGAALGSIILLALVGLGYWLFFYRSAVSTGAIDSIAVLPFTNASGDKESEFLSDGIAETLINNFTKIPELKVTARSTAFRFRGREDEPQEVGRELGVGSVLTGKLLQRGDTLSIQVDLINSSNGVQIWGNRYEGKSADIVNIQQRIATDVSSQLKLKLSGTQAQGIAKTYTQNSEAYQHYLRGRYHWNKRTAEDLKKALQEFQKAADIDPGYALAYVGLADCYVLLEEYAGVPSSESLPKAQAFAQKALQFDDSIGEAHATLGLINNYMWRWAEAEAEQKRAIELNPNYPTAHHWYNSVLRDTGRLDEAMAEIKRGQELDPLSGIIGVNVGFIYMAKHDPNSAAVEFKRIVEFDPNWWAGHFFLGTAYLKLGRNEEALTELQKSVELTNRSGRSIAFLGYAYGVMGKRSEAQAIIKELEDKYTRREAIGQNLAAVYVGLGNKEQALAWLEKDLQARSGELVRIKWYPPFDSLRDDPRFKDILKRMNLPE